MNTEDNNQTERAEEILCDVAQYVFELANDELHDQWERWTARMDTVNDELHELLEIIADLETRSKMRMLAKVNKTIAFIDRHGRVTELDAEGGDAR